MPDNTKVFLGGTRSESVWRDEMIPKLKIDYFNPVAKGDSGDAAAYKEEMVELEAARFRLYVVTPKMIGFYVIIDVVDNSNKRADKTIFCWLAEEGDAAFSDHQKKSLIAMGKMVKKNGAQWFESIEETVEFLNQHV